LHVGEDGRLYAINPEAGFFDRVEGSSYSTSRATMETLSKNTIFTNVALTPDNDVWWEGMTKQEPANLIDWKGKPWTPSSVDSSGVKIKAAHPNSRFTVPIAQCPILDSSWEDPKGVPISAIIFGGRRSSTVPLVHQSFNWKHGTFMGAAVSSEQTTAAEGKVGELRHDPFAMLPFCGYNMADYFEHWLSMTTRTDPIKLPKIFYVNWFKKQNNKFLWPGFGENSRVLKWVYERLDNEQNAVETPIGYIPKPGALDVSGLSVPGDDLKELFRIDSGEWRKEAAEMRNYLKQFGTKTPKGIMDELQLLENRLS